MASRPNVFERLPGNRYGEAERIIFGRVRGQELLLLAPDASATYKDVSRALMGACCGLIRVRGEGWLAAVLHQA
jgi:hypothetical protein